MTSTYVIITLCCASSGGTFCNFSVTLNVEMNCDSNDENWLNLVKVMPKIQVVPFFRTRCIYTAGPNFGGVARRYRSSCQPVECRCWDAVWWRYVYETTCAKTANESSHRPVVGLCQLPPVQTITKLNSRSDSSTNLRDSASFATVTLTSWPWNSTVTYEDIPSHRKWSCQLQNVREELKKIRIYLKVKGQGQMSKAPNHF